VHKTSQQLTVLAKPVAEAEAEAEAEASRPGSSAKAHRGPIRLGALMHDGWSCRVDKASQQVAALTKPCSSFTAPTTREHQLPVASAEHRWRAASRAMPPIERTGPATAVALLDWSGSESTEDRGWSRRVFGCMCYNGWGPAGLILGLDLRF
jgi:hypothetical protein